MDYAFPKRGVYLYIDSLYLDLNKGFDFNLFSALNRYSTLLLMKIKLFYVQKLYVGGKCCEEFYNTRTLHIYVITETKFYYCSSKLLERGIRPKYARIPYITEDTLGHVRYQLRSRCSTYGMAIDLNLPRSRTKRAAEEKDVLIFEVTREACYSNLESKHPSAIRIQNQ